MALRQLAPPPCSLACSFDHATQTSGVVGVTFGRLGVVPGVGHRTRVDPTRGADQVEGELPMILACAMRQFGDEALRCKGMWNIGHRAEPADAGMGRNFGGFHPHVRDAVRHVDRRHC
ncbi:hypothetical protein D9M70_589070 [compost metagenome]